MVFVCGWRAGWLDDRLSVRPVAALMRSAADLGPHSGCFAPYRCSPFASHVDSLGQAGPFKNRFPFDQVSKASVLFESCRNNFQTNLVERFGRFFMEIWLDILLDSWLEIWLDIWSVPILLSKISAEIG